MEIRIQKHSENLKALITVSFGNHLSSPLSEQQCKNRIFGHAKPDNSEKIWHGWCLWQFAWLSQQRKLSTGTAQFSKYQQLSACWESDCCLCHSAKMFGESNPLAEVVQKKWHDIIWYQPNGMNKTLTNTPRWKHWDEATNVQCTSAWSTKVSLLWC